MSTEHELLRGITQRASRLIQTLGGPSRKSASGLHRLLFPHHHLRLPPPQSITFIFTSRGYDLKTAEIFNQTFVDQVSSLKQMYEDQHRQVVETWLNGGSYREEDVDRLISASQSALVKRYNQAVQKCQSKVDEISRRPHSSPVVDTLEKRPTFKIESVPTLEKAFCANAYPSRVDKESIAGETGMEYKQVNIWFQNRRARSKKEGLPLQRTATFAPQTCVPRYSDDSPSPEHESLRRCEEQLPSGSTETTMDPFSITRPAHVFPTPYPPLYDEDPFPVRGGTGSFQTPWLRQCTVDLKRTPLVDVDRLTAQMASLSLSSDAYSSHKTPLPSFTFIPPRAPLSALIRIATMSSCAEPVANMVSAAGLSPAPRSVEHRKQCRHLPRLSIEGQASEHSQPLLIPCSRTPTRRSGRCETRPPSPSHSSRSSSLSSVASSRSSSSTWSVASSTGPVTPISTSPRIEVSSFTKDDSSIHSTPQHALRIFSLDGLPMTSSSR